MIAVIFEVEPNEQHRQNYFNLAASLRPTLESIDGFISVERFQSLTNPEKILSLSVFRDEAALDEWRNKIAHRRAQEKGRSTYFDNYRLRVARIIRDYGMEERDQAPADSRAIHLTRQS